MNASVSVNSPSADKGATKTVLKCFEGLLMVRNKVIKGKGAWYWTYLEPLLVHNIEMGLPKALKEFLSEWVYESCAAVSFSS
ncbi:hypothetical protein GLYMA_19G183300v4 [Glycine max]|uniref:DUF7963 domain-containing protein n=2 Tax=Glycine subgen. Soja TaxID=1462606 RepID=K7MZ24_SOYBN|nr:hypothetical protein GYH30_053466 [Glycine max]KRG96010.1 hypothetical protein GLYMA_19G183300v4 [Glycine max]RZB48560.1 hypothetical protein D0Y65_051862 [Glycine soja]